MSRINQAGIDLIKSFEGIVDGDPKTFNYDPYVDPIGILTIGWGHAITFGERFLRNNKKDWEIAKKLYPRGITREEAEQLLMHDIEEHIRDIEWMIRVPISDNEYAALASFAFNVGARNFQRSSVLRFLNSGWPDKAAKALLKWNKAGGRVLKGLTRRREAEKKLFLTE